MNSVNVSDRFSFLEAHEIMKAMCSIQNIYILSVVALHESYISSCLHFSMPSIEMSCDLDHASMWSNVNVSH